MAAEFFIVGLLIFLLIALLLLILKIFMVVHAIRYEIPHKAMWLSCLVLLPLAEIFYFFFAYKKEKPAKIDGLSLAAFLISALGSLLIPMVNYVVGIVMGAIARGKVKDEQNKQLATSAIIIGAAGIVFTIAFIIIYFFAVLAFVTL